MSIENVKDYLKRFNRDKDVLEFEVSSATVELAAAALSTEPARIAKTLSFKDEDGCILIVTAGDGKINNSKFKKVFGFKAKMLSLEDVSTYTGHEIGGVCPFANPSNVKVYTDISLKRFQTIYPACGSSNSAIKLTCDELFEYSNSIDWIDVCTGWEE
ncbi:MAG: YbaK/EbsC family protein [Clostridium butyricum]|nr:YbaK/EbsC family protein [Clostridium butyricum]